MKRIIALLAVLLTVFLAACSKENGDTATPDTPSDAAQTTGDTVAVTEATEPEEQTEPTTLANDRFSWDTGAGVVGVWTHTITLDGDLFNLTEMETSVTMDLIYRLNADATYTRGMDETQYLTAIATYETAVKDFMMERLQATYFAEQERLGVKKSKIEEQWEQTQKAAAEEQATRFVEGLYLDYRFSELNSSGDYYVEDGKIWFSLENGTYEAYGFTVTGTELTITEVPDPSLYRQLNLNLPLVLKKSV